MLAYLLHRFARCGLGLLTCGLALFALPHADAGSLRLIELTCRTPQESGGDEIRVEVLPDTGARPVFRQSMKKGATWALNQTVPFHKSVQVRLMETDTLASDGINFRDENLGTKAVDTSAAVGRDGVFPPIRYLTFTGNGAHYVLSYQILPNAGREVELVSLRCVITQEKDSDGDELRLRVRPDGGTQFTLAKNGIKAGQTWNIGRKVTFFTNVRVQLIENDGFGIHFRDEDLGTKILATPTIGTATVEFTGHGARYILTYRMAIK